MRKSDIDAYLHHKTVNNIHNSENTTRAYRSHLNQWHNFFHEHLLPEPKMNLSAQTRFWAKEYRDHLVKDRDSKIVKTVLYILTDFYSWKMNFSKELNLTGNPFEDLAKRFRVSKKESHRKRILRDEKVLTDIEVAMMLKHAETLTYNKAGLDYYLAYRNWLIIKMLSEFGMRVSSLISINVSDIDFLRRKIIVESKNQKPYPVPIMNVVDDLNHYIHHVRKQVFKDDYGFLFMSKNGKQLSDTSARRAVNAIAEKLNLYEPQRSTHQLRHYRATKYYREGMQVDLISEIMGVSVPVLKETYLHLTHDDTVREFERWSQGLDKKFVCPECGYDERKVKPKLMEVK